MDGLPTSTDSALDLLVQAGLVADPARATMAPLTGGVSSDIWLVDDAGHKFVVKQPLAELKVADDWSAPLARSASEAGWLEVVGTLMPGTCPRVLLYDERHHLLALEYLDPDLHTLWKGDLLHGRVDPKVAGAVGERLGGIHRATSELPHLSVRFDTDDLFRALRIEPYFLRLVDHHPALEERIGELVASLLANKRALVHGDASPKNILIGPAGPVILDAEAAWWGDPAFDVAFCVNHLFLKCLVPGAPVDSLVTSVEALMYAYSDQVTWEPVADLAARVADLLPALLLARVDGRSPVEYLGDAEKSLVRGFALPRIITPPSTVVEIVAAWKEALS